MSKTNTRHWMATAHKHLKKLMFLPPLLIGVLGFWLMTKNADVPALRERTETGRLLRVITVPATDVVPTVEAFGTAAPGRTWRAIAEVGGRIENIADNLRSGSIQPKGTVLVTIDAADYHFAVDQLEAQIDQVQAQISEQNQSEKNLKRTLKIEEETLTVAESELDRLNQLVARRAGSQADADAQRRALLAQQQRVQDICNSIQLLPSKKQGLIANKKLFAAQLAQANRDLDRTKITAPFDCAIGTITLDEDQFLAQGETLFEAHGIELMKVEAQVAMRDVQRLIRPQTDPLDMQALLADPQNVTEKIFDISAVVSPSGANAEFGWPARFLNIRELLDPTTRTIGVVVGVDRPYDHAVPGLRPPLIKGTYCRVTACGAVRNNQIVIPTSAIQADQVYVLDNDRRLRSRRVEIDFVQGDISVIKRGLKVGELLVVSDPSPAIEGTLIEPTMDEELLQRVVAEAIENREEIDIGESKLAPSSRGTP